MELNYTVDRKFDECKVCQYNPKNMTFKERIKNWWENLFTPMTQCGLCTGEKIVNKIKGSGNKNYTGGGTDK